MYRLYNLYVESYFVVSYNGIESSAGSNYLQKFEVRFFFGWFEWVTKVRFGMVQRSVFPDFGQGSAYFRPIYVLRFGIIFVGVRIKVRSSEFLGSSHYHHNKLHEYQFFRTHQTQTKTEFFKDFFCHSQSSR